MENTVAMKNTINLWKQYLIKFIDLIVSAVDLQHEYQHLLCRETANLISIQEHYT